MCFLIGTLRSIAETMIILTLVFVEIFSLQIVLASEE